MPCWAANIAPWFRLRIPIYVLGFESQAHHLQFFQFILLKLWLKCQKRTKINEKEDGIGPHFKKEYAIYLLYMYDAQSNDQHIKRNDLGTPALLVKYFLYYFAKTEKWFFVEKCILLLRPAPSWQPSRSSFTTTSSGLVLETLLWGHQT